MSVKICHTKGKSQIQGVCEPGTKENIRTQGEWSSRRLEKTA